MTCSRCGGERKITGESRHLLTLEDYSASGGARHQVNLCQGCWESLLDEVVPDE
jgi:hypothetical protein